MVEAHPSASGPAGPRRWILPWILVIVGAVAYANSLDGVFVYDDVDSVERNPHVRAILPLSRSMSAPSGTPPAGRPVVAFSLALNYAVGGLDVRTYHLVNIAVHILNALVLYGIVRRTLLTPRLRSRFEPVADVLGLACALLWMVHPLQTGCVNYISLRTESMAGMFYLLTLYGLIRGAGCERASGRMARTGGFRSTLSTSS